MQEVDWSSRNCNFRSRFGGPLPQLVIIAITESWNGTNWTEVRDMNTGRGYAIGASNTSALVCGGATPPQTV